MESFLMNYFPGLLGDALKLSPALLGLFSPALVRVTQETNLLVTMGPSYVITRIVVSKLLAGWALVYAHYPVHGEGIMG
jgi:hypothetical protein